MGDCPWWAQPNQLGWLKEALEDRGEIGFETAETLLLALKQTAMWRGEERARNRVRRN